MVKMSGSRSRLAGGKEKKKRTGTQVKQFVITYDTFSIKSATRKFSVVKLRQRNVQKSVRHVQSFYFFFANQTYWFFFLAVLVVAAV